MPPRLAHVLQTNYGTFRGWVRALLGQLEFISGRLDPYLTPEPSQVHRLVFVCLGNINRSAFAAEVARAQGMPVCSIGLNTTTGTRAFHAAVITAQRFGIDLSAHAATDIKDYDYRPGDLLLAMEVRHIRQLLARGIPPCVIAPLGHWASPHRIHLHDPHTLSDEYFRTCFALIHSAVINLCEDLRPLGRHCLHRKVQRES
jgi:protein-tyrosine phosphatase